MRLGLTVTVPEVDVDSISAAVPDLLRRWRALQFDGGQVVGPAGVTDAIRVVNGVHPRPPVTYDVSLSGADPSADTHFTVEMTRDSASELAFDLRNADASQRGSVRVTPGSVPRHCNITWVSAPTQASFGGALTAQADVDLKQRTARVELRHRYGRATIDVDVKSDAGQWRVSCRIAARGRGLSRPVVAVVGLFGRPYFRKQLVAATSGLSKGIEDFNRDLLRECVGVVSSSRIADQAWAGFMRSLEPKR